jgi:hypothetical protein
MHGPSECESTISEFALVMRVLSLSCGTLRNTQAIDGRVRPDTR